LCERESRLAESELGQKVERAPALGQEDRPLPRPHGLGGNLEDGHGDGLRLVRGDEAIGRFVDREQTARHLRELGVCAIALFTNSVDSCRFFVHSQKSARTSCA
jgi:hypothetical protein